MKSLKWAAAFLLNSVIVYTPGLLRDAAVLAGGGLVTYGAALINRPAGFVVGGLLLLAGVWLADRKAA